MLRSTQVVGPRLRHLPIRLKSRPAAASVESAADNAVRQHWVQCLHRGPNLPECRACIGAS